MRRYIRWSAVLLLLVLVACGNAAGTTAGTTTEPAGDEATTALPTDTTTAPATGSGETETGSGKRIGLVLSGPVGVNPFLKAIKEGVDRAGPELGAQVTVIESRDIPAIEGNLKRLIQAGNDLVACNSFECVDALTKLAPENPNQRFLIVDAVVEGPNITSAVFREHESAFLVGAMVALVSKNKNVGFVGPLEIPLMHRWSDGYQQGIQYIDKGINVQVAWTGSFEDVAKAKELATIQADKGADIIFPPAASGFFGIVEAAKEKNFKIIGVDSDYRERYPDVVIDSQLKKTGVVTFEAVKAFLEGRLEPGVQSNGLKENGVGLASLSDPNEISDTALGPDVIARLKKIQDKIISGEITIVDPLAAQE